MYVSTRLGRWFYREHGKPAREGAPAIVLWPSFLCDGSMWDAQVGPLSELGRVLCFDGPGHGKSELPPPFSLDDNTRALLDACDALGVDKLVLVGLSWGGMVGMRLALLAPDRVKGLVLLDTSAQAERKRDRVKYRALASLFRRAGMPPWLVERQVAPKMFGRTTLATHPEMSARLSRDVNGFSREGVYRASKAIFRRPDVTAEIAAIRAPTLVLCGEEDVATPPARSRLIADRIPGARLEMVPGAGHLSALEQPDRVNAVLVPFVREAISPPRPPAPHAREGASDR